MMNARNRIHRAIVRQSQMQQDAKRGEKKRLESADIILEDAEGNPKAYYTYTNGGDTRQTDRDARRVAKENGWTIRRKV